MVDSEDTATGGDGNDVFEVIVDGTSGAAQILDFKTGEDQIEIQYPHSDKGSVQTLEVVPKDGAPSDLSIKLTITIEANEATGTAGSEITKEVAVIKNGVKDGVEQIAAEDVFLRAV